MILDSSFLIDLMAEDQGAMAKLEELVEGAAHLAISSLTITEVGRGIGEASTREQFDEVVDEVMVASFGRPEARRAARLLRRHDDVGTPIGAVDAMIAATALERDERVLTRNVEAFRRVDGLRVIPY